MIHPKASQSAFLLIWKSMLRKLYKERSKRTMEIKLRIPSLDKIIHIDIDIIILLIILLKVIKLPDKK